MARVMAWRIHHVEERELASEVTLGHGDDQAQIGLHELALGLAYHAIVLFDLPQGRLQRLLS